MIFENLEPKELLKHFYDISQIPRGSSNEQEISDYLVKFAKDRNLEVIQDDALNIIIKKPGTKGYENSPTVVLQGHMDMVPEKNNDVDHDFMKDPLDLYIDGDFIKARGTTLGADNGIAVAASMAIFDSNNIPHPPLEMLVTSEEEVGLIGANELDPNHIKGRILLNLDSDDEGVFLTSCAGGMRTDTFVKRTNTKNQEGNLPYKLEVKGLFGGHSGADILLDRANANILLARILFDTMKDFDINLYNISGGAQDNAIPREAIAMFTMSPSKEKDFRNAVSKINDDMKKEFANSEKDIVVEITKIDEKVDEVFEKAFAEKIIWAIMALPNGVYSMSKAMDNLVETSNNIGVLQTKDDEVVICSSIRSSSAIQKEVLYNKHVALANLIDSEISRRGDYPAWEYNPNSKIRDISLAAYKEVTGKEAIEGAIHAGLECGVFAGKIDGLDMVSFGPNINNAHTPEEEVSISSLELFYKILLKVLEKIK